MELWVGGLNFAIAPKKSQKQLSTTDMGFSCFVQVSNTARQFAKHRSRMKETGRSVGMKMGAHFQKGLQGDATNLKQEIRVLPGTLAWHQEKGNRATAECCTSTCETRLERLVLTSVPILNNLQS